MPLSLQNVRYTYGREVVLKCLSLAIEEGEWLAVVGSNGSGRSTLAEIAAGLRRPQSGRVAVDGEDIWARRGRRLRRRLGLVMQKAEDQFLGQTVFDDIAFGPRQYTRDDRVVEPVVRSALEAVEFDIEEVGCRSPLEFSGGQRRRLAVAAILALLPSILILDEPFAGLDSQARSDILQLLVRLRDKKGMTILTLTADLSLLAECSRMALLMKGEIGLVGDVRDFVANQWLCRQAGLLLPESIRLALELRERGWNVPVLGREGALEAAIAAELQKRKHA